MHESIETALAPGRFRGLRRALPWGVAAALLLCLSGDRVRGAAGILNGIDVLQVLDFQQVPNVLFLLDTSSSMGGTAANADYWVGGDDLQSRLYQVKVGIRKAISANQGRANFGIGQFGPDNSAKQIKIGGIGSAGTTEYNHGGPFVYVTFDGASTFATPTNLASSVTLGDDLARIFQPGIGTTVASSAVTATNYDWIDDSTGLACPAICSASGTACPAGCESEFLRSFIAVENGFGTPEILGRPATSTPLANSTGTPFACTGAPGVGSATASTACRWYLKSRVFFNNVLFKWSPGNVAAFANTHSIPASSTARGLVEVVSTGVTCPTPPAGLLGDDAADFNNGSSLKPCFGIDILGDDGLTKSKRAWFYLASAGFGLKDPSTGCSDGVVDDAVEACTHTSADDQRLLTSGSLRLELPIPTVTSGTTAPDPTGLSAAPGSAGFPATNYAGTNPNTAGGIQLGGDGKSAGDNTPVAKTLGAALTYFNTSVFPSRPASAAGKQKNVVVLIVDGRENCDSGTAAEDAAKALYNNSPTPDNRIETVVVIYPSTTNATLIAWANAVAKAGSNPNGDNASNERQAFQGGTLQSDLNAAISAAINIALPGSYSAADTSVTEAIYEYNPLPFDPTKRYTTVIPVLFQTTFTMPNFQGHVQAFFNPGSGTTARWDGANDAGDKLMQRMASSICNYTQFDPATGIGGCDAIGLAGVTFGTLTGGATLDSSLDPASGFIGTPLIKRRIVTTTQNGVFAPSAGGGRYFDTIQLVNRTTMGTFGAIGTVLRALWPPNPSTTDPARGSTGILDLALGLPAGNTSFNQTTFQALQSTFGACGPANAANPPFNDTVFQSGHPCYLPASPSSTQKTAAMGQAIKEAREMTLAYIAGAMVRGAPANPNRTLDGFGKKGDLLFVARKWVLAETTLSSPATVSPPVTQNPSVHIDEYKLLREGPRDKSTGKAVNGLSQGFGMVNPDKDNTSASASDMALKPQMSVLLVATNEALHAFRAGTCGGVCSTGDTGGEELWAFVPYDQLNKIQQRMSPQGVRPHTYMLAAGLRFGEVFFEDQNSRGITVFSNTLTGVWRTVAVFGRGIGAQATSTTPLFSGGPPVPSGKFYTALDLTALGAFTKGSLQTRLPIVLWSRGNPDTNDGLVKTASNSYNSDATGYNAYLRMGETWSVPALAFVDSRSTTSRITRLGDTSPSGDSSCSTITVTTASARRATKIEHLFWTGSGYPAASAPQEGTAIFGLDAGTGDVVRASDVCDRNPLPKDDTGTVVQNAIVGNPAVYEAALLQEALIGNSSGAFGTRLYFGDVHGRVWKLNLTGTDTNNPTITGIPVLFADLTGRTSGNNQPVANGLALLSYNSDGKGNKPHVYVESGNDRRFPFNVSFPFKAFGYRDDVGDGLDTDVPGSASAVQVPLPGSSTGAGTQLFALDFPIDPGPPVNGFRGTAQPATAFTDSDPPLGRVFFIGTRFNPAGAECVSSFDSILFAVGAGSGLAAYDFGTGSPSASVILQNVLATSVRVDRGELVIDRGVGPAPPPPGQEETVAGTQTSVYPVTYKIGSAVCKGL